MHFAILATVLASLVSISNAGAIKPSTRLITCDQANNRITVDASARLDPSCTWTRGIRITASDIEFDCQGARIVTTDRRYGILITATTDTALSNITVRNCHVEGFLNNLRVTRVGFRKLAEGQEYDRAYSNILIENSTFLNSRGTGAFIDGYVTGVTLRNLRIEGSGSAGIYLEAGSKDNIIDNNRIINNGFNQNGPDGQFYEVAGLSFWFRGTGREGIAVDGSRNNRIMNNYFKGNSAGAIFLYKNCGEYVDRHPERWFHRRYGADGNIIESNIIDGGDNGIWVASRMGENTLFMNCSDSSYLPGLVLDYARGNMVRANEFRNVTYGIRVEDDGNSISGNRFYGNAAWQQAVIIGTRFRTLVLRRPVDNTTITGNQAYITGNNNPYRWVHGQRNTQYGTNNSFDSSAGFCAGEKPPRHMFLFVVDFEMAGPDKPPSGKQLEVITPEPFPSCPL